MLRSIIVVAISVLLLMPQVAGAQERSEYTLQRGDDVRLFVMGIPELNLELSIDIDGMIDVPFVGQMQAEGRTLTELKEIVAQYMNGQIFRYVNRDGVEVIYTIGAEDVHIAVARYRPITLYGDALLPREVVYRPGMTVRAALAVAGFSQPTDTGANSTVRAAALEGDLAGMRKRRDQLLAARERLTMEAEALIAEHRTTSGNPVQPEPARSEPTDKIVAGRLAITRGEVNHLTNSIERIDERMKLLREREDAEQLALEGDVDEMERIEQLFESGRVTLNRRSDARKAQLFSATRLLQTQDAISRSVLERTQIEHRLERSVSDRLVEIDEEIERTTADLAIAEAEISGLNQQLRLLGVVVPDEARTLVMKIHRGFGERKQTKLAEMDDLLHPGDILEVTYQLLQQ